MIFRRDTVYDPVGQFVGRRGTEDGPCGTGLANVAVGETYVANSSCSFVAARLLLHALVANPVVARVGTVRIRKHLLQCFTALACASPISDFR